MFGYHVQAFARVGNEDDLDQPYLVERFTLGHPAGNGVVESLGIIDDLIRVGNIPDEVIADRGYTYAAEEKWAIELAARNITQIQDIHPQDHGAVPNTDDGYVWIDGYPHCPSIPTNLISIERPRTFTLDTLPKNPTREQRQRRQNQIDAIETFRELIAERAKYWFEKHGKTPKGTQRYICPAGGKVACDACPLSQLLPTAGMPDGPPEVESPASLETGEVPRCCAQETITIKDDVEPKLRQRLYWGSDEWIKAFSQRSRIESAFGILKGTIGWHRGFIRQVGRVKTAFAMLMTLVAQNFAMLLAWAARTRFTDDELVTWDITDHGFAVLDENAEILILLESPPPVPV